VRDRGRARALGASGRERVRQQFLITRLLLNDLLLMGELASGRPLSRTADWAARDPVCGMSVAADTAFAETFEGARYHFCSRLCLNVFRESPDRFVTRGG
jgi:YHS domain-containing protein